MDIEPKLLAGLSAPTRYCHCGLAMEYQIVSIMEHKVARVHYHCPRFQWWHILRWHRQETWKF